MNIFSALALVLELLHHGNSCDVLGAQMRNFANEQVRKPIVITDVTPNQAGTGVQVKWRWASNAQNWQQNTHAAAIIATPSGANLGINVRPNGVIETLPGSILAYSQTSKDWISVGVVDVPLVAGISYTLYATGFVCDLPSEISHGLLRWQQFIGPDDYPRIIRTGSSAPTIDLEAIQIDHKDQDLGTIIHIIFPSRPSDEFQIAIEADGARVSEIGSWTIGTNIPFSFDGWTGPTSKLYGVGVSDPLDLLDPQAREVWHWVARFPNLSSKSRHKISLLVKDKYGNYIPGKRATSTISHWASFSSDRIEKMVTSKGGLWSHTDYATFLAAQLLHGSMLDEGQGQDEAILKYINDHPGESIGGSAAFSITLPSKRSPLSLKGALTFRHPTEVNIFDNAYTRINIEPIIIDQIKAGQSGVSSRMIEESVSRLGGRFVLSWPGSVDLYFSTQDEKRIIRLPFREIGDGSVAPTLPGQDTRWKVLDKSELIGVFSWGLWAKLRTPSQRLAEFDEGTDLAFSDKIEVNVADYPYFRSSKPCVAYADPRSIIGSERLEYSWTQIADRTEKSIQSKGYFNYPGYIFPVGNSAALQVASTSLGANGPPHLKISDWRESLSPSGILVLDEFEKRNFQLRVDVTSVSYPEGVRHQNLIALQDDGSVDRVLIPFDYYPTNNIYFVLAGAGGQIDDASNETSLVLASKFQSGLAIEKRQYSELIDMSRWRWGKVYFHKSGISMEQKAAAEVSLMIENGTPRLASNPKVSTPLTVASLAVFGNADYKNLVGSDKLLTEAKIGSELSPSDVTFSEIDPSFLALNKETIALLRPENLCATTLAGLEGRTLNCYQPVWKEFTYQAPDLAREVAKSIALDKLTGGLYSVVSDASNKHYIAAAVGIATLPIGSKAAVKIVKAGKKVLRAGDELSDGLHKIDEVNREWIDFAQTQGNVFARLDEHIFYSKEFLSGSLVPKKMKISNSEIDVVGGGGIHHQPSFERYPEISQNIASVDVVQIKNLTTDLGQENIFYHGIPVAIPKTEGQLIPLTKTNSPKAMKVIFQYKSYSQVGGSFSTFFPATWSEADVKNSISESFYEWFRNKRSKLPPEHSGKSFAEINREATGIEGYFGDFFKECEQGIPLIHQGATFPSDRIKLVVVWNAELSRFETAYPVIYSNGVSVWP